MRNFGINTLLAVQTLPKNFSSYFPIIMVVIVEKDLSEVLFSSD